MIYAQETSVSVEKSRAELETILTRYGANCFGYMTNETHAAIGFRAKNRNVKFVLPLPRRDEKRFWYTPARRNRRTDQEAYREWEQACRSAWRSLLLCVKAKLEAVSAGITTFEAEFLAHFVLNDGRTFGEMAIPSLDGTISSGALPLLLPESTESKAERNDHNRDAIVDAVFTPLEKAT